MFSKLCKHSLLELFKILLAFTFVLSAILKGEYEMQSQFFFMCHLALSFTMPSQLCLKCEVGVD